MERKNLNIFTKISFFIALSTIIVIPSSIYLSSTSRILDDRILYILDVLTSFVFLASVVGIPLSIVSMFSNENLVKRIFALIVNPLPIGILGYFLMMEFIDEFFRNAP